MTSLLVTTLAVLVAAYLVPGIVVDNFLIALVVAVVLGIINSLIKPVLVLVTLPVNILTLGLFTLVINGLLVMLASSVVPGFSADGLISAIIFSIILGIANGFFGNLEDEKE